MTGKVKRRNLLRRTVGTVLAGAMTIKLASASEPESKCGQMQVIVPTRIVAGEPFNLQVRIPEINCGSEETRWVEVWLGREYLGRFETTGKTRNAEFTLTLRLMKSTLLRVRDFYGRMVVKRLKVEVV